MESLQWTPFFFFFLIVFFSIIVSLSFLEFSKTLKILVETLISHFNLFRRYIFSPVLKISLCSDH